MAEGKLSRYGVMRGREMSRHIEHHYAWFRAKHEFPDLRPDELHRIEDAWGGYWQARAWNFRVPDRYQCG